LGPENVEEVFLVAEAFEILKVLAADQEVVGEVEDMVGLEIGEVAFEEVQLGVDGGRESEALNQLLTDAEPGAGKSLDLVGEIVVDVLVEKHGLGAVALEVGVEPLVDATLAFIEAML
jgi:hypothetical protein